MTTSWSLGQPAVISMLTMRRDDLKLRSETMVLLRDEAGLGTADFENMVFAEDMSVGDDGDILGLLGDAGALDVVLTDHNQVCAQFSHLGKVGLLCGVGSGLSASRSHWTDWSCVQHVVRIVDHHQDEGLYTTTVPKECREIAFDMEKCKGIASTCTLVWEWFSKHCTAALPQVAVPLLGVILIDSGNLDPAARKVTPRDDVAGKALLDLTNKDQQ